MPVEKIISRHALLSLPSMHAVMYGCQANLALSITTTENIVKFEAVEAVNTRSLEYSACHHFERNIHIS